jgi:hypothetical protein
VRERLRAVTGPRVAVIVGLLVLGLVLTRGLGRTKPRVSESRAVAIAQPYVHFTPQGHTIRLLRRGIPPHPYWAVSFWIRRSSGGYSRITLVLLDATTGRVTEVRRTG